MRLDPVGYGIVATLVTALLSTAVLVAVHSWWLEVSYTTVKFSVFVMSVSVGVIAFFIRRRNEGSS